MISSGLSLKFLPAYIKPTCNTKYNFINKGYINEAIDCFRNGVSLVAILGIFLHQSSITSLVSNGVEAVVSAATMGTLAAVFGTFVGGTQSGANGGVWVGLFGNLVGMFVSLVGGAILGTGCGL